MYDFISFSNQYGVSVTISPAEGNDLVKLEVEADGVREGHVITKLEVMSALNIDSHTGRVLGDLLGKIMDRRASLQRAIETGRLLRGEPGDVRRRVNDGIPQG